MSKLTKPGYISAKKTLNIINDELAVLAAFQTMDEGKDDATIGVRISQLLGRKGNCELIIKEFLSNNPDVVKEEEERAARRIAGGFRRTGGDRGSFSRARTDGDRGSRNFSRPRPDGDRGSRPYSRVRPDGDRGSRIFSKSREDGDN